MILPKFKHRLAFFTVLFIFSSYVSSLAYSEQLTTFSGRVVNENSKSVGGITVVIGLYSLKNDMVSFSEFVPLLKSKTNRHGEFSFTDIPSGAVRLRVAKDNLKISMLNIEIGDLTLHPNNHPPVTEIKFSLEPGTKLENALIKIRTNIKPQIIARIVSAKGTPIANASIRYKLMHRSLDGIGYGFSSNVLETDGDGYLLNQLKVGDKVRYYVLGVAYQGYFAKTEPFILHKGQPEVYHLLRLNENPIPEDKRTKERILAELQALLEVPSVWAINPNNQHAYKLIYCHSMEDAMAKATEENAYLISINDKAEEEWVMKAFGHMKFPLRKFWIGLSDKDEEGKWVWDSGEPITYMNWAQTEYPNGNTGEKDFAIVGFSGNWEAVQPGKGSGRIYKAILEKKLPR